MENLKKFEVMLFQMELDLLFQGAVQVSEEQKQRILSDPDIEAKILKSLNGVIYPPKS